MASTAPSVLKLAGPVARAASAAARQGTLRAAADAALRRLEGGTGRDPRHPLAPAAIRVEQARSRGGGGSADQTAVTVWFGQGPSLPVPGGSDALRSAMRIGTGLLGAAALAAMTAIAARREEARHRVIDAPARRLAASAGSAPNPGGDSVSR